MVEDPVEIGGHQLVVARVVQEEGVVAVRRIDLGVADVAAIGDEARTRSPSQARAGSK
jgi:hypothetical protein